ncbi:MAG: hypothetical protein H0Z37_07065, partial [Firmicutes bacterium]|nr:hypothetical protein [Bacillota bacterium]
MAGPAGQLRLPGVGVADGLGQADERTQPGALAGLIGRAQAPELLGRQTLDGRGRVSWPLQENAGVPALETMESTRAKPVLQRAAQHGSLPGGEPRTPAMETGLPAPFPPPETALQNPEPFAGANPGQLERHPGPDLAVSGSPADPATHWEAETGILAAGTAGARGHKPARPASGNGARAPATEEESIIFMDEDGRRAMPDAVQATRPAGSGERQPLADDGTWIAVPPQDSAPEDRQHPARP